MFEKEDLHVWTTLELNTMNGHDASGEFETYFVEGFNILAHTG